MIRVALFALTVSVGTLSNVLSAELAADMVFYNGKILTAATEDPFKFSMVSAVALHVGKILAVGSDDEILKLAGTNTRRVDLKGKTAIPGLIDTHSHIDRYALQRFGKHVQEAPYFWLTQTSWETKAKGLAQLASMVAKVKPGQWITLETDDFDKDLPVLFNEVTRFDLDKVTPNNPVYIHLTVQHNHQLVNTLALQKLLQKHPKGLPGMKRDARGIPTGFLKGIAAGAMFHEILPKPPVEALAPVYEEEMEYWVAKGTTTVSTRLPSYSISAYNFLENKGEMPVRIGYNPEIVDNHHDPDAVLSRLGNVLGMGTDYLWITGVSTVNIDGVPNWGSACIEKAYPRESKLAPLWRYQLFGPHGECKLSDSDFSDREAILAANRHGLRVSNMHVAGDRVLTEYLDLLEEADKERPLAGRRFAVDHCEFVTEEHARRAKKFGLMFSCGPGFLYRGVNGPVGAFGEIYGEKVAADVVVPIRRLIDSGLRTVMEVDNDQIPPFLNMEVLVTRKDQDGKVWGEHQRIDRREALYMYTRWAAEYVLKEKVLGSIEPGKWADLVVLDNDFLAVPEERMSDLRVLMTVVGGRIVYTEPGFAELEGLPQLGYRN